MPSSIAGRTPRSRVALAALAIAVPLVLAGCENPQLRSLTPALEDDSPLARDVGAALAERPEIARFAIAVKSLDEDTVRLSGRVDNEAQRHAAERAAAAVPGVRSVINTLYIRD